jgi:hypothetical protein
MLKLSDDELSVVMNAAKPLEPERRSAFLEAMARGLMAMPEEARGVGSVGRLCRTLQAELLNAPATGSAGCRASGRARTNAPRRTSLKSHSPPPVGVALGAPVHSITSSARASRVGGTWRPSALAVLRLMTSSNLPNRPGAACRASGRSRVY